MESLIEIGIIIFLIVVQSIFGVGLLLFGTPTFLILGYDFANTINILMPVSITISSLQFFKSKIKDAKFINEYNLFCLPFLLIFLFIALKFKNFFDFKLLVALLLIFSSILIMNTLKKADKTKIVIFGIFSCVIIYYLKDLSIALGQTNRIPITLAYWMPIIIIGLLSFVGILQINEK